jgi:tetratricopeptide (TPR) repeat protein
MNEPTCINRMIKHLRAISGSLSVFWVMLILSITWQYGYGQQHDSLFRLANEAYKQSNYAVAENLYQQLTEEGAQAPEIYYNLGNCHFKQKEFAKAILNYERAHKLNPFSDDIIYNLNLTNSYIKDDIEPLKPLFLIQWWRGLASLLPTGIWLLFHIAFFIIALGFTGYFLITRRQRRKRAGFRIGVATLLLSLMMLAIGIERYIETHFRREAIIMQEVVTIMSGPEQVATPLGTYHAGTKVQILRTSEGWHEIKTADGHIGWLSESEIEQI